MRNAGVNNSKIKWCDLNCEFAAFPETNDLDGAKSCRTFVALYCKKLNKIVTKNSPCAAVFGGRRPTTGF